MLTDALQTTLFISVVMWPVTLPIFLVLLGCLIYLAVDIVKHWEMKSVRIGVGVLVVCVLLFAGALAREGQPYSASAARRLYESHQTAYDTVATYLIKEGGSYWTTSREEWPEEIAAELNEVLTIWSLRCGSPYVSVSHLGYSSDLAVFFRIYIGPEYDSGDGGMVYDFQYLAYIPGGYNRIDSYSKSLIPLTGDWYLYKETNI